MLFEWDENKRQANIKKHGYDFADAGPLFGQGGGLLAIPDTRQDYGEDRWQGWGILNGEIVMVAFTRREQAIRLISLRKAKRREKETYNKAFSASESRDTSGKG